MVATAVAPWILTGWLWAAFHAHLRGRHVFSRSLHSTLSSTLAHIHEVLLVTQLRLQWIPIALKAKSRPLSAAGVLRGMVALLAMLKPRTACVD